MSATHCTAHPLGCRCHAMPAPARPRPSSRGLWVPPVVDVDVPPAPPAPRTVGGALDLLVARIHTARRTMRRPQ